MITEYKYHNSKEYKQHIELEQFGLAIDYAKNALNNSNNMCNDCEQMEIVDKLTDVLFDGKIKLFKKDIKKNDLRNILMFELFHSQVPFGESVKTREYLNADFLRERWILVDGYFDGYLHRNGNVEWGNAFTLINRVKAFGTKEAYERFVGIDKDKDKSVEELVKEAVDKNPKFEETINKLIKKEIGRTDFQIMLEMYIKRNLEMNTRLDVVSKLLAKGFNSVASKMVKVIGNVLTNEDVENLVDVNPRVLFNIGVAKRVVKERNKERRYNEIQAKLEAQKQKEMEPKTGLTSQQHCAAINDQVRNLTRLVTERKRNYSTIGTETGCYLFDVVDFLMANRYGFETLNNIVKEKIQYFKNHPVFQFYGARLEDVLKFLKLAEKHSTNQPIEENFAYIINGKVRKASTEEVEMAKNYLKANCVAVNPYTVSNVLRRLIVGGDINSRFEKNCLQIKKNVEDKDDVPVQ